MHSSPILQVGGTSCLDIVPDGGIGGAPALLYLAELAQLPGSWLADAYIQVKRPAAKLLLAKRNSSAGHACSAAICMGLLPAWLAYNQDAAPI